MADNGSIPPCRRIAEIGLIDVVVRHGEKAHVDLPFLAPPDAVHRCAHVIVNSAPGHAAEDPEPVPVRIEQHLVGLQEISA